MRTSSRKPRTVQHAPRPTPSRTNPHLAWARIARVARQQAHLDAVQAEDGKRVARHQADGLAPEPAAALRRSEHADGRARPTIPRVEVAEPHRPDAPAAELHGPCQRLPDAP
jgi:hypothetical protein